MPVVKLTSLNTPSTVAPSPKWKAREALDGLQSDGNSTSVRVTRFSSPKRFDRFRDGMVSMACSPTRSTTCTEDVAPMDRIVCMLRVRTDEKTHLGGKDFAQASGMGRESMKMPGQPVGATASTMLLAARRVCGSGCDSMAVCTFTVTTCSG